MFKLDDATRRKLRDLEFVESASTNPETQCALLEALDAETETRGRFKNSEEMFLNIQREWDDE